MRQQCRKGKGFTKGADHGGSIHPWCILVLVSAIAPLLQQLCSSPALPNATVCVDVITIMAIAGGPGGPGDLSISPAGPLFLWFCSWNTSGNPYGPRAHSVLVFLG